MPHQKLISKKCLPCRCLHYIRRNPGFFTEDSVEVVYCKEHRPKTTNIGDISPRLKKKKNQSNRTIPVTYLDEPDQEVPVNIDEPINVSLIIFIIVVLLIATLSLALTILVFLPPTTFESIDKNPVQELHWNVVDFYN